MTLVVTDLSIHFGGVIAVADMNLEVKPREIVGLIGPNGAGKTTFINCIAGVNKPDTGRQHGTGERFSASRRPNCCGSVWRGRSRASSRCTI